MQKSNFKNKNKNATTCGSFFACSKCCISILLIFCMILSLCGCSSGELAYSFSQVYSFGDVSLTAYGMNEENFLAMKEEILDVANLFEATVSLSEEESELSRANALSQVEISDTLETQISLAVEYYEKTYSTFNILLTPVVAKWGFLPGEDNYLAGEIPSGEELEQLRELTDISNISISNGVLQKPLEYTIDLGGISKGYMADLMWEIMEKYNCDGILTVGGIVVCNGDKMGSGYQVAITNPFGGSYFDVVALSDACLVTSGNYERYFEVDGEIYCHIINPETLSPTTSDVVAVSILSQSATDADVLATALMILEKDKREQLIEENSLNVLLIYGDGTSETFGDFPA